MIEKFKEQAFGDGLEECILKIEKEIAEKYNSLKNKFIIQYEREFKLILAPLINTVESKIR